MSKIEKAAIEECAVLLKPNGMYHEDEIVAELREVCRRHGLIVARTGHILFSQAKAFAFYRGHRGKWYRQPMAMQISGRILRGFKIQGRDVIRILREWVGPTDPSRAKKEAPQSPRARFGEGDMVQLAKERRVVDNAIHVSSSSDDARQEIGLLANSCR